MSAGHGYPAVQTLARQHSQFYLGPCSANLSVLGHCSGFPAFRQCVSPLQARRPRTGTRWRWVFRSVSSPRLSGLCPGSPHPPVVAPPGPSQPWFAGPSPPPAATPAKGANSMNRLFTPSALVFVIRRPWQSPDAAARGMRVSAMEGCLLAVSRSRHTHAPRCPRTDGDTPSSTSSMAQTNSALALGGMHQHSFSQGLSSFFSAFGAPSRG